MHLALCQAQHLRETTQGEHSYNTLCRRDIRQHHGGARRIRAEWNEEADISVIVSRQLYGFLSIMGRCWEVKGKGMLCLICFGMTKFDLGKQW